MKLLLLLLLSTLCARSEVLIYKFSNTVTTNGHGVTSALKLGGYLLIDKDHSTVVAIKTWTALGSQKKFKVSQEGMTVFQEIDGASLRSYLVAVRGGDYGSEVGSASVKGQNSKVLINGKLLTIPKAVTFTARTVVTTLQLDLVEANGSGALDLTKTILYDKAGFSINQIITGLELDLIEKGFAEEQ